MAELLSAPCRISVPSSHAGSGVAISTSPGWPRGLRRLTDAVHAEGAAASAQLGYAGPVADARSALSIPLILLGGITDRQGMDLALAEGFQFVAMGRALLMEPDLINRIAGDPATESRCVHCNKCMPTIYRGTRCVLIDSRDQE